MELHAVARCRTVSHVVARNRTPSHVVASFGGYCEDSGGFCQNRASGGPLDKQVYSLDFLNGSREPCGAKQAPRGGRVGPPGRGDVEIAARPVGGFAGPWTEAGTPRGQPGGLPTGCPHPCPPTAPPSPHFHRWRPGGRDRRHHFDFFPTPLRGCRPCALRLPPSVAEQGQEGEPAKPGEPRRGAPGGSKGRPKGRTGGRHAPAPWGSDHPPLGGFWRGRGSRRSRGNPVGVPREAPSIERKTLH